MAGPEPPDEHEVELDVQPTAAARLARWMEQGRILRARVEAARARHHSIDLGFELVERDSAIGGGLLAGALAYRLFVLLLPTTLLLVSGLGLYADAADKSTSEVVGEAGLGGLIASEVASTASGGARVVVFFLMLPVVLYATFTLYRAVAKVHGLAWHGSGRGVRITPKGFGLFALALLLQLFAVLIVGWFRHQDRFGGIAALPSTSSSPAAHGSSSPRTCRTAASAGRRSFRARPFSVSGCSSSTSSTSTSRRASSRVDPTPTAPSGSRPRCSSRSSSSAG